LNAKLRMSFRRVLSVVVEQRGTALPLAMLTLIILSALIIGFSVVASS